MTDQRLIVFASGTRDGGGSGFEAMVNGFREHRAPLTVAAVVSNHADGGVRRRASALGVPFVHFPGPWTAERYRAIAEEADAAWASLSGWLKPVCGLDPRRTMNIHPGPLPRFGGKGMYGRHVHEAVLEAHRRGELAWTELCMHFVTEEYDEGPVFFRHPVPIFPGDTPASLAARVAAEEHAWQWRMIAKVVAGEIAWDGGDPASLSLH